MPFRRIHTRFRAYQLSTKGSSFSYWDASTNQFVLGEARYNDDNIASITHELRQCGKTSINQLYISSWDKDHCTSSELEIILKGLKPTQIIYPGYIPDPSKQNQLDSFSLIRDYQGATAKRAGKYEGPSTQAWGYTNFAYLQGIENYELSNDKSVIHMWRSGNISVLSLGDVESAELSDKISQNERMKEVDVLILPHHGSSPDFTTVELLKALNPKLCLALVDRQNQYGHPNPTVYSRVNDHSKYISTKDGDIIIETDGDLNDTFIVYNYIANGDECKEVLSFMSKKGKIYHNQIIGNWGVNI